VNASETVTVNENGIESEKDRANRLEWSPHLLPMKLVTETDTLSEVIAIDTTNDR
jgi:hypothetical protein